jgi:hypothetical protein
VAFRKKVGRKLCAVKHKTSNNNHAIKLKIQKIKPCGQPFIQKWTGKGWPQDSINFNLGSLNYQLI